MVDADLAAALERGRRTAASACASSRPAVITAWGEMAAPPASLAGWTRRAAAGAGGVRDDYVGDHVREALARDLGERFTERPVDGGHIVYWDAFEERSSTLRPFLMPQD